MHGTNRVDEVYDASVHGWVLRICIPCQAFDLDRAADLEHEFPVLE